MVEKEMTDTMTPTGKAFLEMYGKVAGSYEADRDEISRSLRGSQLFGALRDDWDLSLEATFPGKVVVQNMNSTPSEYYEAKWKRSKTGGIEFSDVKKVKAEIVLKVVNEEKELMETVRHVTGTRELNEDILTNFVLNEVVAGGKTVYKGSFEIAQKAETLNENDRFYPEPILLGAVEEIQKKIKDFGPLPMDSKHRTKTKPDGSVVNDRDLRETVALLEKVSYNPKDKTVSLDEFTFVDTVAGRDMVALIQGGMKPQVSQRAQGSSEIVKNEARVYEKVTSLSINCWDIVSPGDASVRDSKMEFKVLSEGRIMAEEGKILTEEETGALIEQKNKELKEDIVNSVVVAIKEGGLLAESEETPADKSTPVEKEAPDPKDEKKEEEEKEEEKEKLPDSKDEDTNTEAIEIAKGVSAEVKGLTTKLDEQTEKYQTMLEKTERKELDETVTVLVGEALKSEEFARFSDDQKKLLLESIDPQSVYGQTDLSDHAVLTTALKPQLDKAIASMDKVIASIKLDEEWNYPARGVGGEGLTHVEILNEHIPNGEWIHKMEGLVKQRMDKIGFPCLPDGHDTEPILEEILTKFDKIHYRKLLNEANEEVTQNDIGVRVASIARVVIPAAFRAVTAMQVVDAGTMLQRIEDIPIAAWLPAETDDIADDMDSIEIAENGTIPTAGITYTSIPLVATRKAIRTFITPEAKATARGTAMSPVADAVAGLAQDVARRVDRLLWTIMMTRAGMQASTEVSSYETLTQVGATLEWASLYEGWMQYEFLKTYDANLNPTGGKLGKLYAAPASPTLTPVLVRTSAPPAMTYATHYTVNWPDGTITLTTAGETLRGSDDIQAQYTYTTNAKFWSVVPPTGVDLYNHLINLRQQIGQARVLVANRHYNPTSLAMSFETEDLITSGPQYTAAGATASDMLDRLNNVTAYAGLTPLKTSAMPQSWILIQEKGSCLYRIQTPWGLRGPIINETTGVDYYLAEEFSGYEVPVTDKLVLVGVTDINT